MLIKKADDRAAVAELEALQTCAKSTGRRRIEEELRAVRAGVKGERDSAYLIDFAFERSEDMAVIHDLRLEFDGRVAQIDHLLIHRSLQCFVLETKHFHAGLKITEAGEFLRATDRKGGFEGMPSPLAQNERHVAVLRDVFGRLTLPQGPDGPLSPVLHAFVLVSPHAWIDRPERFDTRAVIKADLLPGAVRTLLDAAPSSTIGREDLESLARQVAALHRPIAFDYRRKFGLSEDSARPRLAPMDPVPDDPPAPRRRRRKSRGLLHLVGAGALMAAGFVLTQGFTPNKFMAPVLTRFNSAPVSARPPAPAPGMRSDDHSLTASGQNGTWTAEIHGNLPQIRQEMRTSRLGASPVYPKEPVEEAPVCDFKAVMTDAEIAACRKPIGSR